MNKLSMDIQCENCKRNFVINIEKIRPGQTKTCPFCGATIQFTGDDGRKLQNAVDDFERKFFK